MSTVVGVTWAGGACFDVDRFGARSLRMDAYSARGATPYEAFVGAVAACAATELVRILEKQRAQVESLEVRVEAAQAVRPPRRLESLVFHFAIGGKGITPARAARAVELAVTQYCGIRASLAADVAVTWTLAVLNQPPARRWAIRGPARRSSRA